MKVLPSSPIIKPLKFWDLVKHQTVISHFQHEQYEPVVDDDKAYFLSVQKVANEWPVTCLPDVSSFCPHEMCSVLRRIRERWGVNSARVSIWAEHNILDSEGILEAARLAFDEEFSILAVAPLDWSCCIRLSEIGVAAVEVQAAIPEIESAIQRRSLLQKIVADAHTDVWFGGNVVHEDLEFAISVGSAGICIP